MNKKHKPNTSKGSVSELWKYETVFNYIYPRLDEAVSKQRNHLLKAPCAVHPATGRVCVPFDPAKVEDFDPSKVPTLQQLAAQLDRGTEETDLRFHVGYFQNEFLKPLLKSVAKERRDNLEREAALDGTF